MKQNCRWLEKRFIKVGKNKSFATCQWFSPGTPVSSTNKIDRHDITEILLKVVLNTITLTRSLSYKGTDILKYVKRGTTNT
jgi:hypothetical protein